MDITSKLFIQEILISKLGRHRTTRILLPKAYYKYPNKKFPVLYMLDGQNLFYHKDAYARAWELKSVMDKLPLKYQVIIVGIDNGGSLRMNEYLPYSTSKIKAEGKEFVEFIVNELKPKVDQNLRTLSDRNNTLIAGSSMGGLLSYYAGITWGHIFGKVGVMSPSFWINPAIIYRKPATKNKIYTVASKTESQSMAPSLQNLYYNLRDNGFNDSESRVIIRDKGTHSEIFWKREFPKMLKWLLTDDNDRNLPHCN